MHAPEVDLSSLQGKADCVSGVAVVVEVLLYVHRNRRLIRDGSPGRPP